jgi:tRNA pseudouridine55 synthase
MVSAIIAHGVPLTSWPARAQEVERERVRQSTVSPSPIGRLRCAFEVRCTKGTYVSTLAHDVGQALGCARARPLRRTSPRVRREGRIAVHRVLNLTPEALAPA